MEVIGHCLPRFSWLVGQWVIGSVEIMLYYLSLINKLKAQGRSIFKALYIIIVYMLK